MIKKINLFKNSRQQHEVPKYIFSIQWYGSITAAVLFVFFIAITFLHLSQESQIAALLKEKESSLNYIAANKDFVGFSSTFIEGKNQLNKYEKLDANVSSAYSAIKNSIDASNTSAIISEITMDKTNQIDFTLSFPSVGNVYQFLKYSETDAFLSNFLSLKMNDFNLSDQTKDLGYTLHFVGKIKK